MRDSDYHAITCILYFSIFHFKTILSYCMLSNTQSKRSRTFRISFQNILTSSLILFFQLHLHHSVTYGLIRPPYGMYVRSDFSDERQQVVVSLVLLFSAGNKSQEICTPCKTLQDIFRNKSWRNRLIDFSCRVENAGVFFERQSQKFCLVSTTRQKMLTSHHTIVMNDGYQKVQN